MRDRLVPAPLHPPPGARFSGTTTTTRPTSATAATPAPGLALAFPVLPLLAVLVAPIVFAGTLHAVLSLTPLTALVPFITGRVPLPPLPFAAILVLFVDGSAEGLVAARGGVVGLGLMRGILRKPRRKVLRPPDLLLQPAPVSTFLGARILRRGRHDGTSGVGGGTAAGARRKAAGGLERRAAATLLEDLIAHGMKARGFSSSCGSGECSGECRRRGANTPRTCHPQTTGAMGCP